MLMINHVMPTAIANVLAQRYASQAIQDLWSERACIGGARKKPAVA